MSIIIKKSDLLVTGHMWLGICLTKASQEVWFTRKRATQVYSISACEKSGDIFLEDYFYDLDNPTDIELSLLELEHGIVYMKDE